MEKYDAIFCDIDGTLLDDKKKLHQEEIDSIKKITEKDIPFILVSGRLPSGILNFKETLDLDTPIIAFGGGLVYDENGNILYEKGLDRKDAVEVYEFAKSIGNTAAFNFYKGVDWYTDNINHPMEQWEINSIGKTPIEADITEITKDGEIISKCLFAGEPEEIDAITIPLQERFPNLHIVKSLPNLLEVVPLGVSKSKALGILADHYDYNLKNSMAIGDNFNDIDMLEAVGHPVVMANAPEDLKKLKNAKITKADNNHNGVSEVLEEIV